MIRSIIYGLLIGHSAFVLFAYGYSHLYCALLVIALAAATLNIFKIASKER